MLSQSHGWTLPWDCRTKRVKSSTKPEPFQLKVDIRGAKKAEEWRQQVDVRLQPLSIVFTYKSGSLHDSTHLLLVIIGVYATMHFQGAGRSSRGRAFAHGAMGRRIDPKWGGPIEQFLVPASAPRLV